MAMTKEETPTRLTPASLAWRRKLANTPNSSSRAKYHPRKNITGNSGVSGATAMTTTSTSLAHDALLSNLNSALKALGGTPLNARSSNRFITEIDEDVSSRIISPIQPMRSLEDDLQQSSPVHSADKVMKMQEKHSQLVQQCAELERSVIDAENKRDSLHKKLMDTQGEIQTLKQEKALVSDALETLSIEHDNRRKSLDSLRSECKNQESVLGDIEKRIQLATNSLRCLEDSKAEHMDALEHVKDLVKSKKKKIKKLDGIIDDKKMSIQELGDKQRALCEEIKEATATKDELLGRAAKAQQELQESEETRRRLECLSSEGYVLVEDQSRKATLAQEKWEKAEEQLAEIESQLVEASARLEAKKAMIRELEESWMDRIDIESVKYDGEECRSQILLLRQLKETTAAKLKERMKLTEEIESLRKSKQRITEGSKYKDPGLDTYCQSLERALEEATAEVDRLQSKSTDSSDVCQVLQAQLHKKENQLSCALDEIDHSNKLLDITRNRVQEIETAYGKMIEDFRGHEMMSNVGTPEENSQPFSPCQDCQISDKDTDVCISSLQRKDSIVARLRRERYDAMQRIQGISGQTDQIRSCLHGSIMAKMYDSKQNVYKSIHSIY
jgi:chromosome segregation ATPase